jgi:hypothetical protein
MPPHTGPRSDRVDGCFSTPSRFLRTA